MYSISDNEVEFILNDLEKKGIATEDVRYNLLDHICCIIEQDKPESKSFQTFYEDTLLRFFKHDLKEIEEETQNLLTFKNFYAMKTTLKISGLGSALITLLGATLKVFHLPGAAALLLLGAVTFSLIFLPTMIALKFKDEEKSSDKWVLSFGFLIAMITTLGITFKLMHWPGANIMMLSGISSFVFLYVPIYFITRYRRAELRFNTSVNSALMMASGGLLFGLMNLGHSTKSSQNITKVYDLIESNHQNIASFSNQYNETDTSVFAIASSNLYNEIEGIKEIFLECYSPKVQHDYIAIEAFMINNKLSFDDLMTKVETYNSLTNEKQQIDAELFKIGNPYFVCLIQLSEIQTKLITNLRLN